MTVTEHCPHAKVQRSDCLVCVLEDNRRETRAELLSELLDRGVLGYDRDGNQTITFRQSDLEEIAEEVGG